MLATGTVPLPVLTAVGMVLLLTASVPRLPEALPPLFSDEAAPPPPTGAPGRPVPGSARQMIPAEVLRVIDGDTVEMRAMVWLDLHMTTRVRIKDIDAPEAKGRCPQEARLAVEAAAGLERMLAGERLFLTDLTRDKYGGRVVARIVTTAGADIGAELLRQGLARPYAGSRQRGWCA